MQETVFVHLVTAAGEAEKKGILDLLADASGVVMGTMVLLLLFSVISWYIIGYKFFYLRRAQSESSDFLETFWQSKRLDAIYQSAQAFKRSPVSQVFKAGYIELTKLKGQEDSNKTMSAALGGLENVERALRRAASAEVTHLESLVPFLATVGSTARAKSPSPRTANRSPISSPRTSSSRPAPALARSPGSSPTANWSGPTRRRWCRPSCRNRSWSWARGPSASNSRASIATSGRP